PVAAVIAIGIVAWRVMAQRKTPIAAAASEHAPPAPAVAPPAPPTPMPKAPSVTPLPKTPPPVPTPPPVVPEAALEPVPRTPISRHGHTDPDLRVRCHKRGLHVLVDGRDSGVRCPANYKRIHVAPGDHTVGIVRASGGAPVAERTVKV